MLENENTVAEAFIAEEASADDAQTMDMSIEELAGNLTEESAGKTGENDGDASQTAGNTDGRYGQADEEKVGRRISSALKNQRRQIFESLGATEEEIREMVRSRRAEAMAKDDPDISVKAARRIIEAEERANPGSASVAEYRKGIQTLIDDGWTREELQAFSTDETVREHLADGMTLRQAARAYLRENRTPREEPRRSAVPRMRTATASAERQADRIAEMTDEEFREFDRRIHAEIASGKRVRF